MAYLRIPGFQLRMSTLLARLLTIEGVLYQEDGFMLEGT